VRQETSLPTQALTISATGNATGGPSNAGAFACKHHRDKTVVVRGTFSGSVTVLGSLDGTNFYPVEGPVTAPCIISVPQALEWISASGSGWVSGTANVDYSGFNSRSDPG
jgi:hypothetical protein